MRPPPGNVMTGAEAAVRMLERHGVEVVFGLCGDTSLPLYDALGRLDHGITHVLTRDERAAAYMADGYARVSGRVGVCEAPSGGGATYLVPGVVEAEESSVPLLAVTSDIAVAARGRFALTELDQQALFRPLARSSAMVDDAARLPAAFRMAFAAATAVRPGAVHLGLPFDVQTAPVDEAEVWADAGHGRTPRERPAPDSRAIAAAAAALAAAERPLVVCGGGVVTSGAEGELAALAERLGMPVATSVSGKGAIADGHPLAVGVVGSNGGTQATRRVVDDADMVLFVGCRAGSVTTERWRHPDPERVRVVHADADPRVIGVNYRTQAALVGDAKACLAALAAEAGARADGWGAAAAARARDERERVFRPLATADAAPVRPERLVAELQAALPDDAVVVADAGTPCPYLSAYYRLARPGRWFLSNRAHGALGYALPAAAGARFARPSSPAVAVMGDGSFGMVAGELETLVRLGVQVLMVVVSNAGYGWIKAGQRAGFGERYFGVDFSATDHAAVAAAYGVWSRRVADPAELAPALAAALDHGGPALIDVVCQPLHEARAPVSEWVA